MLYRIAADLMVTIHIAFIAFVMLGGLLVLKWRWVSLMHLPAAIWGALIEYRNWLCPLTVWEQEFRRLGLQEGYAGGFVERYVLPLLYPAEYTRELQIILGSLVLAVNLAVYAWVIHRRMQRGPISLP